MPHTRPCRCFSPWLQEAERVMKTFKDHLHLPVTMIDDTATMMATLQVSLTYRSPFGHEYRADCF